MSGTVLEMGQPLIYGQTGSARLESSTEGWDLRVQVDGKLNVSQQCLGSQEAKYLNSNFSIL